MAGPDFVYQCCEILDPLPSMPVKSMLTVDHELHMHIKHHLMSFHVATIDVRSVDVKALAIVRGNCQLPKTGEFRRLLVGFQ